MKINTLNQQVNKLDAEKQGFTTLQKNPTLLEGGEIVNIFERFRTELLSTFLYNLDKTDLDTNSFVEVWDKRRNGIFLNEQEHEYYWDFMTESLGEDNGTLATTLLSRIEDKYGDSVANSVSDILLDDVDNRADNIRL